MDILVTGASGFVGRAIVEELISDKPKDWKIYSLGNKQIKNTFALPNFLSVDITDSNEVSSLDNLGNIDTVFHSAGLAHQFQTSDKKRFFKVNFEGTKNILEFAAGKSVKHFILISSVSVYGSKSENRRDEKPGKIDENEPCFPKGGYAESKFQAEQEAIKICLENNIALTILRLATVIGEGDKGNVNRLIMKIDQKRFLMIGDGKNYKTLIYKKDVARACRVILEKKDLSEREVEVFNVAAEPVQMKYIVETISTALAKKTPKFFVPLVMIKPSLKIISKLISSKKIESFSNILNKWTSDEIFANEKIRQKYSFEPETPISEGVRREVVFYLKGQKC